MLSGLWEMVDMIREAYPLVPLPWFLEPYAFAHWFHYSLSDIFPFALFAIGFLFGIQERNEEDLRDFGADLRELGIPVIAAGVVWILTGIFALLVVVLAVAIASFLIVANHYRQSSMKE